jgi:hypothetical protein
MKNKIIFKKRFYLIGLLLSVGLVACSDNEVAEEPGDILQTEDREALLAEIRRVAGPAYASSNDQCKVVGIGAKACGGPERYMLYSTETTDEGRFLELIERYNALARAEVQETGEVSDCAVVPEPVAYLRNGVCTTAEHADR